MQIQMSIKYHHTHAFPFAFLPAPDEWCRDGMVSSERYGNSTPVRNLLGYILGAIEIMIACVHNAEVF